mgnify:CR=1 FL=1
MKGETSYYKILGVNENASNHELRKAFCKLSIELHPDTTSLEIDDAKSKFQEVLEAYENLNNSNLRKIYDDKLKEKSRSKNKVFNSLIIDSKNQNLVESGYRILANHGQNAGQEVAHFHIHIFGGEPLGPMISKT